MDGPRDCHTEWNKKEEKNHNITYMWNLEKRHRWTYLQSRNRITDVENKLMVIKGGGTTWEIGIDIYTLLCIKWASQVVLVVKSPPTNAGDVQDVSSIPELGRSLGGGHGNPLQYSCLENPMDRGAWWTTVHTVAKTQTWLQRLNTHMYKVDNQLYTIENSTQWSVMT